MLLTIRPYGLPQMILHDEATFSRNLSVHMEFRPIAIQTDFPHCVFAGETR